MSPLLKGPSSVLLIAYYDGKRPETPYEDARNIINMEIDICLPMDILGSFLKAPKQFKYLMVVVDYFIKWIEVEALTKIIGAIILKFLKRNV